MVSKMKETSDEDEIRQAFKLFDKNGDDKITLEELKEVMLSLGEELTDRDAMDMIKEADKHDLGHIIFEDFKAMMMGGGGF